MDEKSHSKSVDEMFREFETTFMKRKQEEERARIWDIIKDPKIKFPEEQFIPKVEPLIPQDKFSFHDASDYLKKYEISPQKEEHDWLKPFPRKEEHDWSKSFLPKSKDIEPLKEIFITERKFGHATDDFLEQSKRLLGINNSNPPLTPYNHLSRIYEEIKKENSSNKGTNQSKRSNSENNSLEELKRKRISAILEKSGRRNNNRKKVDTSYSDQTFKLQGNFDIETYLDYISNIDSLVYINGSFYTLGKITSRPRSNRSTLTTNGRTYELEKSISGEELEDEVIQHNLAKIEDYEHENFQGLQQKFNNVRNQIETIKQKKQNRDNTIVDFIENYVYPIYDRSIRNKGSLEEIVLPDEEFSLEEKIHSYALRRRIFDSLIRENGFNRYIGIAISEGRIRSIPKEESGEQSRELMRLDELNRQYKQKLKEEIDELIVRRFNGANSAFENAKRSLNEINLRKARGSIRSPNGMHYSKQSDSSYTVFVEIPDYIVKLDNDFFYFRGTRVGKDISFSDENVTSTGKAFIFNDPGYDHPFISGGSGKEQICYGRGNDPSYQEKFFGIHSKPTKVELAQDIVTHIKRGIGYLRSGHHGRGYRRLESSDSAKRISKKEALNKQRGKVVIYDNDFSSV